MIFMGTYIMPGHKTEEWTKCVSDITAKELPSCIKKWQTFPCSADYGKGYNLIFTEKGRGDEALIEIAKLMLPLCKLEGASWKLEPLMSVTDAIKILG